MNKLLAILLFPFIWVAAYLYRIIWVDLISIIIKIFKNLIINFGLSLFLFFVLPFVILVEIPIALIATCAIATSICDDLFCGKIRPGAAFLACFKTNVI